MELPIRKKIRLKEYDYSRNGAYFITICTQHKRHFLSEICRGGALLLPVGQMVENEILALEQKYDLIVDRYIIMPNHLHLLLRLERAEQSPAPTISEVICTLKSITTKKANLCDNTPGRKIWQRSFYDHIIRNEQDYLEIWRYIDQNPLRWELDEFYTAKEKPLVV